MDSATTIGFVTIGFLVVLQLICFAFAYGKLSQKVEDITSNFKDVTEKFANITQQFTDVCKNIENLATRVTKIESK